MDFDDIPLAAKRRYLNACLNGPYKNPYAVGDQLVIPAGSVVISDRKPKVFVSRSYQPIFVSEVKDAQESMENGEVVRDGATISWTERGSTYCVPVYPGIRRLSRREEIADALRSIKAFERQIDPRSLD